MPDPKNQTLSPSPRALNSRRRDRPCPRHPSATNADPISATTISTMRP